MAAAYYWTSGSQLAASELWGRFSLRYVAGQQPAIYARRIEIDRDALDKTRRTIADLYDLPHPHSLAIHRAGLEPGDHVARHGAVNKFFQEVPDQYARKKLIERGTGQTYPQIGFPPLFGRRHVTNVH